MKKFLDKISVQKTSTLLMALIGFILAIIPGESIKLLTASLGAVILGYGVYLIVNYIMNKNNNSLLLALAIVCFFIGLVLVINSTALADIALTIIGVIVFFKGLTKLYFNSAIGNTYGLCVGIFEGLLGIILLINPFSSAALFLRIIGIFLLISALADFITNKDDKDKTSKKEIKQKKKKEKKNPLEKEDKEATELDFEEKNKD